MASTEVWMRTHISATAALTPPLPAPPPATRSLGASPPSPLRKRVLTLSRASSGQGLGEGGGRETGRERVC